MLYIETRILLFHSQSSFGALVTVSYCVLVYFTLFCCHLQKKEMDSTIYLSTVVSIVMVWLSREIKVGNRILRGPHNEARFEKILKILHVNVSKLVILSLFLVK